MSADPLVTAWIELQLAEPASDEYEKLFWSLETVEQLIDDTPEQAMSFIVGVVNATESSWVLDNLAAGPVEDLLARHAEVAVTAFERESRRNPRLIALLDDVTRSRVEALRKR